MIRNTLFSFFFFTGIVVISILFLPSLIFPQKIVLFGGKLFGYWSSFCLKFFLNTKINIKGKENIINDTKFFIASSHQSMFETFFLQTIFNSPKFILKYELLKIPVFGWYLSKIGSIYVNRNKISKDNIGLMDKIKNAVITSDRPIIIFPQGTRVLPDERVPFKKGVGRIYSGLNIKCQPIAINSGTVWPKKGSLIKNKTITISILEAIEPGLDSKEFTNLIEKKIYSELDNID
ncbi:1-acyl-sn-glycerol-3-phosphate acyltransferase [Candidatus Pelagibacter sp.]|nr:1-acyl-sn-glycerol-3-phosphate acyltransferase [Candidatus Pelagibacter sp.]